MTTLRSLGVGYLIAASAFGVAEMTAEYPDATLAIQQNTADAGQTAAALIGNLGATLRHDAGQAMHLAENLAPAHLAQRFAPARLAQDLAPSHWTWSSAPVHLPARVELALAPPEPWDGREHATTRLPRIAPPTLHADVQTGVPLALTLPPHLSEADIAPPLAPARAAPPESVASAAPPAPAAETAATGSPADVEARLRANLTPELLANFSLFLYVSKAESGPVAQHMYVFDKAKNGKLTLLHDWLISTGREETELTALGEKTLTDTPRGYYELDPKRMYVDYTSHAWKQPMPYAMFFNWESGGAQTGLAIHAATGGDIQLLGSRASAGCIHLSPENARTLFNLIRSRYHGPEPQLAYDRATRSTSNKGELAHDTTGQVKTADGYRVLVAIENYGGENVVAALF